MTERLRSKRPLLQSSRQMILRKPRPFLLSPLDQGSSAIVGSKTLTSAPISSAKNRSH